MSSIPAPTPTPRTHHPLLIIGGGPTGLFLALLLAQRGLRVHVLEAAPGLVASPRATTYVPIVLHEFRKAGIYERVAAAGHQNDRGIVFRTPQSGSDEVLATVSVAAIPKDVETAYTHTGIHLGQHQLAEIILSEAEKCPGFSIEWGVRFQGCREEGEDGRVTVVATGASGEKWYTTDYLVGCDGAGSAVRRALCIPFEGFTWKDRMVATNVYYDFEKFEGYSTANMIVDSKDWGVIARAGPASEGLWRVAFGVTEAESADLGDADKLQEMVKRKYEALFPGPRPLSYKIHSMSPYYAHQRVAQRFHRNRTILCGDSAHSNNPVGGLGLTTGLLDATALANVLTRIVKLGHDARDLLERYDVVRRKAFVEYTNPTSIRNKLRLHGDQEDVVREREEFFRKVNSKDGSFAHTLAAQMNEVMEDNFEWDEKEEKGRDRAASCTTS